MQILKMALRSIASNKMRAMLTMLGIIIGVMSLVVLVSIVNGTTSAVTDSVSSLGSSLISVNIQNDKGNPLTISTLEQWTKEEAGLGALSPSVTGSFVGKYENAYETVTVYGVTPAYYDIQGMQLIMGRWLKPADLKNKSHVCILDNNAAKKLIGYEDCVGSKITLGNIEFTVIGVLKSDDNSLASIFSGGALAAYVPYHTLLRLSDSLPRSIASFYAAAPVGGTIDGAKTVLEKRLLERFDEDEDAFEISTSSMLEETLGQITSVLSMMLGGIAAISLIVGGIGIMNIMMVTVTERTREIGIRKAIGASRKNILSQFLLEAVVLCMIGCGLGISLSWAILRVVSIVVASAGVGFKLNSGIVIFSVIFCFIIGIVFGLYPANKAAKMKPIDALHYGG